MRKQHTEELRKSLLRDPYFFEIIFSQREKYPQVDVLLLEHGEVLRETDLFQELCQILQEEDFRVNWLYISHLG